MAKLVLSNPTNLQNEATVVATLAANNDATEVALENTLSRDGTSPNTMLSNLDMNSYRITNLPAPVGDTEPVRLSDLADSYPAFFSQAAAPSTSEFTGSLWIDSDSTDLDLYQLVSGVWTDTGVNLKGSTGATGATGAPGTNGTMAGPVASVDSEIAIFSGTGGSTLKRATNTGLLKAAAGVIATATAGTDYYNPGGTDVAIADGGTGSSTAAGAATNLGLGTGDSPQFTAVNIGNATDTTVSRVSAGVIAVEGVSLYPAIPQSSKSAAYTTVLADANTHILHPSADTNARTFTIDSNANVAYPIGTTLTFINQTSQVVTIAITTDTMTLSNSTTTGSRSLAQNGIATAIKITSTAWIISGSGLT